jgi:hypothetical protein
MSEDGVQEGWLHSSSEPTLGPNLPPWGPTLTLMGTFLLILEHPRPSPGLNLLET